MREEKHTCNDRDRERSRQHKCDRASAHNQAADCPATKPNACKCKKQQCGSARAGDERESERNLSKAQPKTCECRQRGPPGADPCGVGDHWKALLNSLPAKYSTGSRCASSNGLRSAMRWRVSALL